MTIVVSAFVSLTLTPMMASRFLKAHDQERHGRLYALSERFFDGMLHAYERGLDLCLRFRFVTLLVFFATLGLTVYLFMIIPKGFFPQQDTGLIYGTSEASQDISFADMYRHQEELGKIVQADPAVATVAMALGLRRLRGQQRPHVHPAEAARRTRRDALSRSSRGCGRSSTRCKGRDCSCRPRRT